MAGNRGRAGGEPFDPPSFGRIFRHPYGKTVLVSTVFFLVLFGLLAVTDSSVPTPELVAIALVPFIVLLISTGRLQELRFGDLSMKFQRAVQGGISPDIASDTFDVEPEEQEQKGGTKSLDRMIENRGSTLVFDIGGWYNADYIDLYLERLLEENPNFRYVLFNDREGRFRGLMTAAEFVAYVWSHRDQDHAVVDAIQSGDILADGPVVTTRILEGSTLGEARRKLEATDDRLLAVVDTNDEFVGVLTREHVNGTLLSRLLGRDEDG